MKHHFTNNQVRRRAIEAALRADPDATNREMARRVGCCHKTVGVVRRRLDEEKRPENPDEYPGDAGEKFPQGVAEHQAAVADLRSERDNARRALKSVKAKLAHANKERSHLIENRNRLWRVMEARVAEAKAERNRAQATLKRLQEEVRLLRAHPPNSMAGTFTQKEINDLLQLCHPDLHQVGGNREALANRITAKLNDLRRS